MSYLNSALKIMLNPGTVRGFNPQPEPPREALNAVLDAGTIRAFNPQPEPPRQAFDASDTMQDFHFKVPFAQDWFV